jgi:hypothetical protein
MSISLGDFRVATLDFRVATTFRGNDIFVSFRRHTRIMQCYLRGSKLSSENLNRTLLRVYKRAQVAGFLVRVFRRWEVWKRALRGETLSSHPSQGDETVRQRIAEHSLGRR